MQLLTLQRRSLAHHWRAHLAAVLGVVAGTAALTGALLVGDSMRGSLRAAALERLDGIDYALQSPRFFRAALAEDLGPEAGRVWPAILERGSATHAHSRATVHDVTVLAIRGGFERLDKRYQGEATPPMRRIVILNQPLADELRARRGDDVLLRIGKPAAISPETLLGRRDDTTLTLRLAVHDIIPAEGLGTLSLQPRQAPPRNAYVPLATLQRGLRRRDRVNTLLVTALLRTSQEKPDGTAALQDLLQQSVTLADLGLRLRTSDEHNYLALESDALLLAPPVEQAARNAAGALGVSTSGVLAYLANSIAVDARPEAVVPYSTVAALDAAPALLQDMTLVSGQLHANLAPGEVLLNQWAAEDLGAIPGDRIRLSYYVTGPLGGLDTRQATFRLRGVVRLAGATADPGFTPEYPGVTDADRLTDWDPPFPIDLRRIRDKDETYWDEHGVTPKAFISLADGRRLWSAQSERFGSLTSLRIHPLPGESLANTRAAFEQELLKRLDVASLGLTFENVRARALAAGVGTTDFAGLFIGFSFFLIISAAMLVALLFRLGVERRAREIGLLLATGFSPRRVAGLLLLEGALLAIVGVALGLPAASGYTWLMLTGLRSWWADAVNAPFLQLHVSLPSHVIGAAGSTAVALISIAWSLRGITRRPPQALLAAVVQSGRPSVPRRRTLPLLIALLAGGLAGVLMALSLLTEVVPETTAFFFSGSALLLAGLAGLTYWLRIEPRSALRAAAHAALLRLGIRNARRHVGRSLLTTGLIACATFVITALQAMRLTPPDTRARDSGTGGCALLAESAVPLPYDLNTPAGHRHLNLTNAAQNALAGVSFIPFRLRDGDEASCLNLYRPTQPRLLGASDVMIERGGFAFAATLAESDSSGRRLVGRTSPQRRNPWTLLRKTLPDGAVPAIADEAAARWQMHLALGDEVRLTDERGGEARLRLVGLLKGSVLQGEVIIAEEHFMRLFPSIAGHAFYLIDAPADRVSAVEQTLERELADFGFAISSTSRRLADLFAVQNTYLSTFQTLGGLGLLLGTIGLAAVLLRNVYERRSELALLRTLGFSRAGLGTLVLAENAFLVGIGLLVGLLSAAVVVAPHVAARATPVPWVSLVLMFGAVFAAGLLAGVVALVPALRAPLLPALRAE